MSRFLFCLLFSCSPLFAEESPTPVDFTWAPASYAPLESPLASKYFTPEIRLDESYHYSFAEPADNTISGSSEVFRHNELQTTHLGL